MHVHRDFFSKIYKSIIIHSYDERLSELEELIDIVEKKHNITLADDIAIMYFRKGVITIIWSGKINREVEKKIEYVFENDLYEPKENMHSICFFYPFYPFT